MESKIEETFSLQLRAKDITYGRQIMLGERRYKYDFVVGKYTIECNGGTWVPNLGHSSGKGILRDYKKANYAVEMGYIPLTFSSEMIESGEAIQLICKLLKIEY